MKKQSLRFILLFMFLSLAMLAWPSGAGAFPPLPSSLYGRVAVDGVRVADGTLVEALINNQVYAYTTTLTYEGDSAYSMDVPGDDLSTDVIEGGVEGDIIVLRVGGKLAGQTATWRSGTNQELDLSVTSQAAAGTPTALPQATPTNNLGEQAGQDPSTATQQALPTSAPGDGGSESQPGVVEQAPEGQITVEPGLEATATFRPGVVEFVDESYPPTATPEPGAQGGADPAGPASPAVETAETRTISVFWVLVPVFFLCVWLFGLWYLKRKNLRT